MVSKGGFGLQLDINDQKVKKVLMDSKKLIKQVGLEMAKKIYQRFSELESSPNFKAYLDYGIGKPHPLVGNLDNLFGISLTKNYRLIVEPITDRLDDVGLRECKKINIKGVVDYHGGKCEWIIP